MKKTAKKPMIIVLVMLLVCALSVAGTLAYLQDKTDEVTNTFVVGDLFDENNGGDFDLKEHEATYTEDGEYVLSTTAETDENRYDRILPGVDLPKDPFVRVAKLKENAYVFIEVVDGMDEGLSATVDTAFWTELNGATGKNGGTVYVYALNNGVFDANGDATAELNILADKKVVVASDYDGGETTLSFYGYIIQAGGFNNAAEAWAAIN